MRISCSVSSRSDVSRLDILSNHGVEVDELACDRLLNTYSLKMGKARESSYRKINRAPEGKAHTNTRKFILYILMITDVFLDQKRVNVCEHTVKMCVCVRLSLRRSLHFSVRVFPIFCVIRTLVISFPRGLYLFAELVILAKW